MKIVFFGNPSFASNCLKFLNSLDYIKLLLVVTNPDKKMGRGQKYQMSDVKKTALKFSNQLLKIYNFNDNVTFNKIKEANADLFVVVAYKYLPEKIYTLAKYGAINLHASLLPKYRGSSPIQYALINGDNKTGLTTFFINNNIDCGNIIHQEQININNKVTFTELYNQLSLLSDLVLDITLKKIIKNPKQSHYIQQKDYKESDNKSLAPKIKSKDFKINFNNKSIDIHNKIRALNYKGAFATFNGSRVKLFNTFYDLNNNKLNIGDFILSKNENLLIGTAKGVLIVGKLQLENRKIINSKNFYNSYNLNGKFE